MKLTFKVSSYLVIFSAIVTVLAAPVTGSASEPVTGAAKTVTIVEKMTR